MVWGVLLLGVLVGQAWAAHFVSADDCDWRTGAGAAGQPSSPSSSEVALRCRLQALRTGPEGTNFSLIQPDHTTSLAVLCSALFTESHLGNATFANLRFLRALHLEQCKLALLPPRAFAGLSELRNLTVRTYNGDWGALSLSLAPHALEGLDLLQRLDLGHNNMLALPPHGLCSLRQLRSLNLTHNVLETVAGLGCLSALAELDVSHNRLRQLDDGALAALGNLRWLHLRHNRLDRVAPAALAGLAQLQLLDLSHNRLAGGLPPGLLSGTDLRELYLQNNTLSLLSPHTFADLQQLVILNLSRNHLSSDSITHETFADLIRLVILDLSHNQLRQVNGSTFQSQYTLQILHLEHNLIESLDDNAFSALYNLHTLMLSDNRLKHLSVFTLNGLFMLINLALDHNHLENIHLDGFRNCSSLQDLQLSANKLAAIPDALQYLHFLISLDLSDNHITSVSNATLSGMPNLHILRLAGNRIGNMTKGTFQSLHSLRRLDLSNNQIGSLEHGIFDDAAALNVILLNDNLLEDINGLFMNLAHLRLLNVSCNSITWFDYALVPRQLKHLDIHHNAIEVLGNYYELEDKMHLKIIDASNNHIREINAGSFPNQVEMINLSSNRISIIHPFTFMIKHNLTKVNLTHNRLQNLDINAFRLKPTKSALPEFWIADNIYFCDCSMEWLQRINSLDGQYPQVVDLAKVVCQMPFGRRRPRLLLAEANSSDFLCKYKSHCFALCHCCEFDACDCEMVCPENCTCYSDQTWNSNIVDCSFTGHGNVPGRIPMDVTELYLDGNDMTHLSSHSFIGRKNLRALYLNNSNIQSLHNRTFNGLVGLQTLHLDHNKITALQGFEFENLTSLRELHLSHNRLSSLSNRTFGALRSLELLRLDNNYLLEFPVWLLRSNALLRHVQLGHNPWSCGCQFLSRFQAWARGSPLRDAAAVRCGRRGPFLLEFDASSCGANGTGWAEAPAAPVPPQAQLALVPLLIAAPSVLVLLLLGAVLAACYRRQVKLWLHSRCGLRPFDRAAAESPERLFDAFVAYCPKDEPFVAQVLAAELEACNGGGKRRLPLRLCLRHRDLAVPGCVAEAAVVEAVQCSHRTVVVVSEQFLRNEWCRFELKAAQASSARRLIAVLLDDGGQEQWDLEARQCLRAALILRWGERRFWQKLRYALPDPHRRPPQRGAEPAARANAVKLV